VILISAALKNTDSYGRTSIDFKHSLAVGILIVKVTVWLIYCLHCMFLKRPYCYEKGHKSMLPVAWKITNI
jgi:hypothetical protein